MIIGIDEVGRGCWAGPLVACAAGLESDVVLPPAVKLDDSKKLSRKQRENADTALRSVPIAFALGWVEAAELDAVGMTEAVRLAMQRAYDALPVTVRMSAECVIVDGSINYLTAVSGSEAVIKADGSVPAVSAASILAKVARDKWMTEAALRYPDYGFEKHVGYGTALHMRGLQELGVCDLHRKSFKPVGRYV